MDHPITITANSDDDDDYGSATIDSPPRPVRTSSPRQNNSSSPLVSTTTDDDAPALELLPPAPNNTAPRIMTSPTSGHHRLNATNFMKYGSIRPPISVLQNEFCTTYRLWEEHDAVLRRVVEQKGGGMNHNENGRHDWRKYKPKQGSRQRRRNDDGDDHSSSSGGSSSSSSSDVDEDEEWEEAFAHLRTLYSRHHRHDNPDQQFIRQNSNDFLESLFAIDDEDTLEEKLEEEEEEEEEHSINNSERKHDCGGEEEEAKEVDATAIDYCEEKQHYVDEKFIDNVGQHRQQEQRKQRTNIENLVKLLFRPGSKLSGIMESSGSSKRSNTAATTIQREYNLVIMEENKCDELGRLKGYLARHKSGSDEQCVFVHVKFVPLSDGMANFDEEDSDEKRRDEKQLITNSSKGNNAQPPPPPQSQSPLEPDERITIQINFVDGDKNCCGYWNPDTLSFEGIVQKVGDGNNSQGPTDDRGGGGGRMRNSASNNNVIMSGLISGSTVGVGSSNHGGDISGTGGDNTDQTRDGATTTAAASSTNTVSLSHVPKNQSTFSLSPCTHLHPRGRSPMPLWRLFAMPHLVNMMGAENISLAVEDDWVIGGGGFGPNSAVSAKKKSKVSEQDQIIFLDELASDDNRKFALHRARTERLLLDTLVKLVELGSLIDFAELARKRNLATRREKWRGRMRKVTPKMPRKFKRRKNKEVAGDEEFDISTLDGSVQKKKVQFYDHLAAISWDRLLEAASVQAERTCAAFRRRSALLDGLTFRSSEYKFQVMSDLRANGLTLASSHSEWDQCIQMGRTVALGWSWFERGSWGCFERSAVVGKRCVYLLFQMHSRLGISHELLEKSFRSADARISIARLESLKQVRGDDTANDDDSEGNLCGVCQCDIHEVEGEEEGNKEASVVVTLPCSHSFHWNCIREWLHDHSKCPICRVDLNE